jgi:tetratricopeptide (TPR) repeat protein
VRRHFPSDRGLGGEAAFRAGELLRAGGEELRALEEFRTACELSSGGEFAFRASLELGHLLRRRGDPSGALDAYLDVIGDPRAAPSWRDDASIWAGRVWYETGRAEEARRWWSRVAHDGEDPRDRLRAYDQLALALVDEGDLEGAAGMLEQCRRELSDVALEETPRGERVRNALMNMRALDALRRAIARRRDGVRIDGRDGAPKKTEPCERKSFPTLPRFGYHLGKGDLALRPSAPSHG